MASKAPKGVEISADMKTMTLRQEGRGYNTIAQRLISKLQSWSSSVRHVKVISDDTNAEGKLISGESDKILKQVLMARALFPYIRFDVRVIRDGSVVMHKENV